RECGETDRAAGGAARARGSDPAGVRRRVPRRGDTLASPGSGTSAVSRKEPLMARCRRAALAAMVAALCLFRPHHGSAHAALRLSDPVEGATLGDSPALVRLSFSERPEGALSDI